MTDNEEIIQKVETLKKRVASLEFIIALLFSICLALIYALSQILHIVFYSLTFYYGVIFFIVSFFSIEFIIYLINIIDKVGVNIKKISNEWKTEKLITKIGIVIGLPSFLFTIYQIAVWLINLVSQYLTQASK